MINKLQVDFCLGGFGLIIYQWKVKLSSTQVSNTSSSCSPSQTEIQQNNLKLFSVYQFVQDLVSLQKLSVQGQKRQSVIIFNRNNQSLQHHYIGGLKLGTLVLS